MKEVVMRDIQIKRRHMSKSFVLYHFRLYIITELFYFFIYINIVFFDHIHNNITIYTGTMSSYVITDLPDIIYCMHKSSCFKPSFVSPYHCFCCSQVIFYMDYGHMV